MSDKYDFGGACAMEAMCAFLSLEGHCDYTAEDRDALYRDLDLIACASQQLDAGQRERSVKTVDMHDLPFIWARITANAMRLRMSGVLDELD